MLRRRSNAAPGYFGGARKIPRAAFKELSAMKTRQFFVKIRDLIFPQNITCDLCGAEIFDGGHLCAKCEKTITYNDKTVCPVCGRKTERAEICAECKACAPRYKKGVSVLVYSGGGAQLIKKFKSGAKYLKDFLGGLMAEKAKKLPPCDAVTYVPITKKRRRQRGYNQAELLAKVISEKLDIPLIHALEKRRDTDEQKSLSLKERAENLKGCFRVCDRAAVKGKTLLLADDVLTTGATADGICSELLSAGAKAVFLVTAASVEYKPFTDKENMTH